MNRAAKSIGVAGFPQSQQGLSKWGWLMVLVLGAGLMTAVLRLGPHYIDYRIVGGVVVRSGFGGGITTRHFVSRRRWNFQFYEVMTSDGSLSPDGTRIWDKHFSGRAPIEERSRGVVDHYFDLTPTRFVRVFWKFWDINCASDLGGGQAATTASR